MSSSASGQTSAPNAWPELPAELAPPTERSLDTLSDAELAALAPHELDALIVDEVLREGVREDAPPLLREALRVHLLEKLRSERETHPFAPPAGELPEPPAEASASEVEQEIERRLAWQRSWDERRAGYEPSPEEIERARRIALERLELAAKAAREEFERREAKGDDESRRRL